MAGRGGEGVESGDCGEDMGWGSVVSELGWGGWSSGGNYFSMMVIKGRKKRNCVDSPTALVGSLLLEHPLKIQI